MFADQPWTLEVRIQHPVPFIDDIRATLSEEDTRKVLSENAARLFGFDLERLAARKRELREAA